MSQSPLEAALKRAAYNKARHLGQLTALEALRTIAGRQRNIVTMDELSDLLRPGLLSSEGIHPRLKSNFHKGREAGVRYDVINTVRKWARANGGKVTIDHHAIREIRSRMPLVSSTLLISCSANDIQGHLDYLLHTEHQLRTGEFWRYLMPDELPLDITATACYARTLLLEHNIYQVVLVQHESCPNETGRHEELGALRTLLREVGIDVTLLRVTIEEKSATQPVRQAA